MSRSPYTWTSAPPRRAGFYFLRYSEDHEVMIVEVFKEKGEIELSYRYGSGDDEVNWVVNLTQTKAQWSDRAIPLPAEPDPYPEDLS